MKFRIFILLLVVAVPNVNCDYKCEGFKGKLPDRPMPNFRCFTDIDFASHVPICGDPDYHDFRRCQVAKFQHEMDDADLKRDTNGVELRNHTLLLISGCLLCDKEKVVVAKLELGQKWSKGSYFTLCRETWESRMSITKELNRHGEFQPLKSLNSIGFSISGIFSLRRCIGLFSVDEPLKNITGIELKVEHNCRDDNKTETFKLPDFVPNRHSGNMPELIGLKIDLGRMEMAQQDPFPTKWKQGNSLPEIRADEMQWTNEKKDV